MPVSRGDELLGVNIAFFVVASCTVLLRCYTRVFISKAFGLDDWLMTLACIFFLGYVVCSNTGVHYGTGQHREDLTPENYAIAKRYWYFCYVFFGLSMMTAKLSFGWLLLRIVSIPSHKWVIYGASLVVIVAGIVYFFVTILQCHPVAHYWNDAIPGQCIPMHIYVSLGYLYSAICVATDLFYALLPAFIIWHLQVQTEIRWVLFFLMGLGCVASIAVLVKVAYFKTFYDPDFLYATTDIAIWSTIEMGLAITAASFSTLRPLARRLGFNIGFTDYNSSGSNDMNNEFRRPSQPAQRRPSQFGMAPFTLSQMSQDTLNGCETRDKSISSQATAHYGAPKFDRVQWSTPTTAHPDLEEGNIELSLMDRTMDHSTSKTGEKQNAVHHTAMEL
ncbi:hypothetical protein NLG97_g3292 [Lecanicillium saksenae]|uniref:Uncharacterized protein n=1 Tax=Lecanicillium saksenae TaxID=468837 RepID=A0ACC1R098_9HYPO|nr:hypothetical protein NLG97_g3292 [Lecanicillium saksenae]